MNTQQTAVAEYLPTIGVSFSLIGGTRTKREKWDCFAWHATFKAGKNVETFDYFMGLGHVKKCKFRKDSALYSERPEEPTSADVLYSLLLDAEAYSQPFHEWADNFGYDKDSIKAHDTYRACVDSGLRLSRLFDQKQREHLSTLLQDY